MARYIDADALSIYFDALIKHAEMEGLYNMAHVYERCLQIVKDAPTADVAPRAEIAKEIFEEIRDLIRFTMEPYSTTLYAKIEFGKLEALRKKYTNPEPPKGD